MYTDTRPVKNYININLVFLFVGCDLNGFYPFDQCNPGEKVIAQIFI